MHGVEAKRASFWLGISYARPAELSVLYLQVEAVDTPFFRRGCSTNGKDIIARCLVKLEVILRCVYSAEFHECKSALRDKVESQELASRRNGFIVNQIDKTLECLGQDLGSRSLPDFRSVARSLCDYATPHDCAALLKQAFSKMTSLFMEEIIYDDEVETGVIVYDTKSRTDKVQQNRLTSHPIAEGSSPDFKKSRSAMERTRKSTTAVSRVHATATIKQ